MSDFEPDSRKKKSPATFEDYELVRDGKATAEQIAKVREALANQYSPLRLELGEDGPRARWMIQRQYTGPRPMGRDIWPAYKNFLTVCDFLREKRMAGVISEAEWKKILSVSDAEFLHDSKPSPSIYAMGVTRMIRAIKQLRPDLAEELRKLPISRNR